MKVKIVSKSSYDLDVKLTLDLTLFCELERTNFHNIIIYGNNMLSINIRG